MIFLTKPSNSIRISSMYMKYHPTLILHLLLLIAQCVMRTILCLWFFILAMVSYSITCPWTLWSLTHLLTDWLARRHHYLYHQMLFKYLLLTFRPFYEDLQPTGFVFWPFSSWCYIIQHPCVQAANRAVQCSGECALGHCVVLPWDQPVTWCYVNFLS